MGEIQKMRGIKGKVALITGAGRGIGKAGLVHSGTRNEQLLLPY